MKRAPQVICGTLGTTPLQMIDTEIVPAISPLPDQPEDIARSITLTRLYADLLFEGSRDGTVVVTNYCDYATKVVRIDSADGCRWWQIG